MNFSSSELLLFAAFLVASVVINVLLLAAFGFILRKRLREQHVALEERINGLVHFIGGVSKAAVRRKQLTEVLRDLDDLRKTLDSVCVLSGIVGSTMLRSQHRLEVLESERKTASKEEPTA